MVEGSCPLNRWMPFAGESGRSLDVLDAPITDTFAQRPRLSTLEGAPRRDGWFRATA